MSPPEMDLIVFYAKPGNLKLSVDTLEPLEKEYSLNMTIPKSVSDQMNYTS